MNSFKDGLRRSGQSVLDARAQNLYEMTKIEEERFIQECKMKVLRIKNELNKHRDLSVKSTTSLEVGNGFDPKAWVAKRHQLERDLRVANIEYALALKVDGEEFPAASLTFNDKGKGFIIGSFRVVMPNDDANMKKIQQDFGFQLWMP